MKKIFRIFAWTLVFYSYFGILSTFAQASIDPKIEAEVLQNIAVKISELGCPTLQKFSSWEVDTVVSKAFLDGSFSKEWFEQFRLDIASFDPNVDIKLTPPKGMMVLPKEYAHFTVSKEGRERNYILVFFPDSSGVLCEERH